MIHQYVLRFAVVPMILLLVMILVTAGFLFLLAALFMTLLHTLTPPLAALATGGAALVVALFALLVVRWWIGSGSPPARHATEPRGLAHAPGAALPPGLGGAVTAELGSMMGQGAMAYIEAHPKQTLLISLCAGLATGASPGLRKVLRELF